MKNHRNEVIEKLQSVGMSLEDSASVRRIAMTLHRWYELECGTGEGSVTYAIERDDETGTPYMYRHDNNGSRKICRIPDKEKGAIKRLRKIMSNYPDLIPHLQTDPRGASVYICKSDKVSDIEQDYYRGVAVHK